MRTFLFAFFGVFSLLSISISNSAPGENKIKVEGKFLGGDNLLRVKYAWLENGQKKRREERITALPHQFTINISEPDTARIKCLYLETETETNNLEYSKNLEF